MASQQGQIYPQRWEKVLPSLRHEISSVEPAFGYGPHEKRREMKIALFQSPTLIKNDIVCHIFTMPSLEN